MRLPWRCYTLGSWIRQQVKGREVYVTFGEMWHYFFSPLPQTKARRYLDRIESESNSLKVYLKGWERPIYFPPEYPISDIKTGITEVSDPEDFHYYEIPETAVGKEDVVVDCGAAEGFFTAVVAGRCRQVYAIEPSPTFVNCLRRTFQGRDNVNIVDAAMSDSIGEVFFKECGVASVVANEGIRVSCQTIDSLFYEKNIRVDYLKADIEGEESKMLAGAAKTIAKYRPKLAITTYHVGNNALEIKSQILAMCPDYKIRIKGINTAGMPVLLHAWM